MNPGGKYLCSPLASKDGDRTWATVKGSHNTFPINFLVSIPIVVQSPSRVQLFATPRTAAHRARLSTTVSQSLHKFMSIESVMPSNHLILCHPLLCLQSFSASGSFPVSQFLSSSGQSIEVSAYISPSNEYSGLISFKFVGWISLQSKELWRALQHHNSKTSILGLPCGLVAQTLCSQCRGPGFDLLLGN